jgi:hypothetical protein
MPHQLETLVLDTLSGDLGTPSEGELWYNNTLKALTLRGELAAPFFRLG